MTVTENAYAKINLFLDVTGRREDGFHNIRTLMHSVSLCDYITLTATPSDNRSITINSSEPTLKTDESNLIYKSAMKYMSYFDINASVEVELEKHIPIGAGLGGGSSDAAATLRAMNRIFGLATKEQLYEMAAQLGSDVPFCIDGGCAICTGRGEEVTPYDGHNSYPYLVIAIGESRVSTPKAYELLDKKYGDFAEYNAEKNTPDMARMPIYNIFETVIDFDEIDEIKKIMTQNGAESTLMSGSGPSVFGIFPGWYYVTCARKSLEERGYLTFRCTLI